MTAVTCRSRSATGAPTGIAAGIDTASPDRLWRKAWRVAWLLPLALALLGAEAAAAPEGLFCRTEQGLSRTFIFDIEQRTYQELICADHCSLSTLTLEYEGTYFLNLSDPHVPANFGFNKITSELTVTSHNRDDAAYLKAVRYLCESVSLKALNLEPPGR